ncbi:MAG: diguanylate cyclase [Syntrophales bacterium]
MLSFTQPIHGPYDEGRRSNVIGAISATVSLALIDEKIRNKQTESVVFLVGLFLLLLAFQYFWMTLSLRPLYRLIAAVRSFGNDREVAFTHSGTKEFDIMSDALEDARLKLQKQTEKRRHIEAALLESQKHLEQQVEERTAELTASRASMQHLLAASPAIIYTTEASGQYKTTYVSPNVMAEMGYNPEEFTSKPSFWLNHIHPDDGPAILAGLPRILEMDRLGHEYRFRFKDGRYHWIHDEMKLVRDQAGRPFEVIGFWMDITEHKRTEEALIVAEEAIRKRETLLNETGKMAHVGGWELDVSSLKQVWTEELYRIFEVDSDFQPNIENGFAFFTPDFRPTIEAIAQRAIDHGEPFDVDTTCITAKGNFRWVRIISKTLQENGKIVKLSGTMQDITEYKRTEEALIAAEEAIRKREALLNETGKVAHVGGWELDVNSLKMVWTEEIYRIYEVELDFEPNLENGLAFFTPESRPDIDQAIQQAIDDGKPFDVEMAISTTQTNTVRWVHIIGKALQENGKIVKLSGTMQDITERRGMEEALRQAKETLEEQVTTRTAELEAALHRAKRHSEQISLLGEMGGFLQSSSSLEEAYVTVGNFLKRLLPGWTGAVYLTMEEHGLAEAAVKWGDSSVLADVVATDSCWALRRERIHLKHDPVKGFPCTYAAEEEAKRMASGQALLGAYICLPLTAGGETLGIMHLRGPENDRGADPLEEATSLVQTAAEQIALSLANIRLREELRSQSIRDPLTGLFNRRYLDETLAREALRVERSSEPLSVIMLDIDHFKNFNDDFGHEAGDLVLRNLGVFLQKNIRGSDIACRYGGEEFTILLPGTPLETALERAEKLRTEILSQNFNFNNRDLGQVKLSLGVATCPIHAQTGEEVIAAADGALYQAKQTGRNRVLAATIGSQR